MLIPLSKTRTGDATYLEYRVSCDNGDLTKAPPSKLGYPIKLVATLRVADEAQPNDCRPFAAEW